MVEVGGIRIVAVDTGAQEYDDEMIICERIWVGIWREK